MVRLGRSLVAGFLFLVVPVRAQETCGLTQVTNTTGGNTFSLSAAIDAAGNRIAFASNAPLLGPNTNLEIFLWDASSGFTQITNTTSGGSVNPAIDAIGNRIAFESNADPLGSNSDGNFEIFLWDASTGLAQITNTTSGSSVYPAINAAGDRIAFVSSANLVGSNSDGSTEIFLWDASAGLSQITNATSGTSFYPAINAVGNRISFVSSSNLVGSNSDGNSEIFLWDASTGFTQITNTSVLAGNSGISAINAAGNRIAFESNTNLLGSNGDANSEIFLWDASAGFTQITNTTIGTSLLPAIDAAGDRIAFRSDAPLVSNSDRNLEIFLWDASAGLTQITNTTGGNSDSPAINAAGNRIAFHSDTDPLGSNGDRNSEIFLFSCPPPLVAAAVPAVSPLGLGVLAVLLGLAAAWTLRRRLTLGN